MERITNKEDGVDLLSRLEDHLNHALQVAKSKGWMGCTTTNRLAFDRDHGMDKLEKNSQWGFTLRSREPLIESVGMILQDYFLTVFQSRLEICQGYHGPTNTMLTKLMFTPTDNALRLMFLHPSQVQFETVLRRKYGPQLIEEGSDKWGRALIQTGFIVLYTWAFISALFFSVMVYVRCGSVMCIKESIYPTSPEIGISMMFGGIVTYLGKERVEKGGMGRMNHH